MTRKEAAMILGVDFANAIGTLASLPPSIRKKSELNKQIFALDMAIKALAPEPVVHGEWIVEHEGSIRCSECCFNRAHIKMPMDFCPNCGAKMDGGKE